MKTAPNLDNLVVTLIDLKPWCRTWQPSCSTASNTPLLANNTTRRRVSTCHCLLQSTCQACLLKLSNPLSICCTCWLSGNIGQGCQRIGARLQTWSKRKTLHVCALGSVSRSLNFMTGTINMCAVFLKSPDARSTCA